MNSFRNGGITPHPANHIKVKPFEAGVCFSTEEDSELIELLEGLFYLFDNGRCINIRRHIASLKISDAVIEECIIDITINNKQYNKTIGACEIQVTSESGDGFYVDSSILYSIAHHRYKPPAEFIQAVGEEVARIRGS